MRTRQGRIKSKSRVGIEVVHRAEGPIHTSPGQRPGDTRAIITPQGPTVRSITNAGGRDDMEPSFSPWRFVMLDDMGRCPMLVWHGALPRRHSLRRSAFA